MRNYRRALIGSIIACAIAAGPAAAAQFGRFLKRDSKVEYMPFKDAANQFALEYPKDWQVIGGAGDVLVTFAQKKSEAALVVERFKMNTPLAPEDVTELFTQIEADVLKERQPKATEIVAKVIDNNGHRLIIIDYARPGLAGPEKVRQCSFPMGAALYRLTFSAPTAQFAKYDPIFAHIAGTFASGGSQQAGAESR